MDSARADSLKKDQRKVHEQETEQNEGIIQWIARRLNSDVYIEIDVRTRGGYAVNKLRL